jgi:hypothetical protein
VLLVPLLVPFSSGMWSPIALEYPGGGICASTGVPAPRRSRLAAA